MGSRARKGRRGGGARRPRCWPYLLLAGLLALVGIGVAWAQPNSQPSGQPRLVVDQDVIDLGTMAYDEPAKAEFRLTNAGDGALRIAKDATVDVIQGC